MVAAEPAWSCLISLPDAYEARAELHLLGSFVLGIDRGVWFCRDSATGHLLWERKIGGRPNTIIGLSSDVIVATEYRYDGPAAFNLGIYGISLATQKVSWTSHRPKPWGRLLKVLDSIPGFANEFRDAPVAVRDGQVWTQAGRILDTESGRDIGSLDWTPDQQHLVRSPTVALVIDERLDCGEIGTLYIGTPKSPQAVRADRPVRLHLQDKTGGIVWEFDASKLKEIGEPRYAGLGIHYLAPYLYLTVSDRPQPAVVLGQAPPPAVPAQFSLWTLDVRSGQIVQKIPINQLPATSCNIVDGDKTYLLVSFSAADKGSLICLSRMGQNSASK